MLPPFPTTLPELLAAPRFTLFAAVSGSRAYGTALPGSDEDLRGIFAVPAAAYLGLAAPPAQLADARGDVVHYSLRRTLELLATANPNLLELLYSPADCIRADSPEMQLLREQRALFVSRDCATTHTGYALGQVRKARGQNKWINNPQPEAAPTREQHCHVIAAQTLREGIDGYNLRPRPLAGSGIDLAQCHAAKLEHARDVYRLYHYGASARGVFREGGQLVCESIPPEHESTRFAGLLLYHEQAYQQAMTEHRNYWTWRRERNEARWRQQETGELDYDAKNLMHTVRLLLSGRHILEHGEPRVRFEGADLDLLLRIRAGAFAYGEILELAEGLMADCERLAQRSSLPPPPDAATVDALLRELTALWEARVRA